MDKTSGVLEITCFLAAIVSTVAYCLLGNWQAMLWAFNCAIWTWNSRMERKHNG